MPTLIKPGERPYRLICLYGPTGAGKSWFGVSAEARLGGRTLVLMVEGADSGLVGFDVDILVVKNMDELREALRNLKVNNGSYKDEAGVLSGPYTVLVLDSLSQMQRFSLAVDSEAQYRAGNTSTPLNIPLDAYKRVGEDIRRSVWFARTLPMHIVLICLDRVFVSQDNTVRMIGPNLSEGLSGDIRAYADIVGYMTAEVLDVQVKDGPVERRLVRRLFLQPGKDFHARVRAGKGVTVPEFIAEPTMEKVLKVLDAVAAAPTVAVITPSLRAAHERAEATTKGGKVA